jgi:uncharacterized alkaline shock family protein YloU
MESNKKDGGKKLTIDEKQDGVGGRITLNEDVVATIAGLAARAVEGIHALGKSRLIPFGDSPTRGVAAEVGSKQAAFDIDVVIDYGRDIRKVASELRQKIASEVNKMAGREVVEVNINVIDIRLPEEEKPPKAEPRSRVQ